MGILNKIKKKGEPKKIADKQVSRSSKNISAKDSSRKSPKSEKGIKKSTAKVKRVPIEKMPDKYFDMIVKPHISEKTFNLSQIDQYVFIVSARSNKSEIKKAIKNIYGVSVVSVNIINVPSRTKRFRGRMGVKSGYRKAMVKLAKGHKIELMKESK
ncbi:50S ribosomal protein L23 [Patescibacteria group bacterium]|nr:50S ribosomal protein L23 [Patescibacteria group bacterium]